MLPTFDVCFCDATDDSRSLSIYLDSKDFVATEDLETLAQDLYDVVVDLVGDQANENTLCAAKARVASFLESKVSQGYLGHRDLNIEPVKLTPVHPSKPGADNGSSRRMTYITRLLEAKPITFP